MCPFSKKLNSLFFLTFLVFLPFFAQAQITGRGTLDLKQVLAAKSIASFEKGALIAGSLEDLGLKNPAIIVLYDNIAPWTAIFDAEDLSKINQEPFQQILAAQNLVVVKSFELDEMNNGFIVEPKDPNLRPDFEEAARLLSKVDYVLMVHLKELQKQN